MSAFQQSETYFHCFAACFIRFWSLFQLSCVIKQCKLNLRCCSSYLELLLKLTISWDPILRAKDYRLRQFCFVTGNGCYTEKQQSKRDNHIPHASFSSGLSYTKHLHSGLLSAEILSILCASSPVH